MSEQDGLIDQAVLVDLNQQVGPESVQLIVSAMLADLGPAVGRIEQARTDRDRDLLQREAHRLKGAVGSLGARDLAARLLQVQLSAAEDPWERLDALVETVATSAVATELVLRAHGPSATG